MKIRDVSDLHLEMFDDNGHWFLKDFPKSDVLIASGDICATHQMEAVMSEFAERSRRVIWTLGNHEFYGHKIDDVLNHARMVSDLLPNVHLLENEHIDIDGVRFHGATLWFNNPHSLITHDFDVILDLAVRFIDLNNTSRKYLKENVREGDIVVTHYLPSHQGTAEKFQGKGVRQTNNLWCNNLDSVIYENRPSYWFHGHTHESLDYTIGDTRIICNPRGMDLGYGDTINKNFNINLEIEIK